MGGHYIIVCEICYGIIAKCECENCMRVVEYDVCDGECAMRLKRRQENDEASETLDKEPTSATTEGVGTNIGAA